MSDNNFNFTLQNLNNILSQGNEQLINFRSRQYSLKTFTPKIQNRIQVDQDGKLFVQKDGQKQYRISKEKYGLMPNFCPQCGRLMGKHPHDSFFWNIHKRCFKCSVIHEQKMKQQGVFEIFAINYMMNNLVTTCDQAILFYEQSKKTNQRDVLINEQGDVQNWSVQNKQQFNGIVDKVIKQILQYKDKAIEYFKEKLNEIEKNR